MAADQYRMAEFVRSLRAGAGRLHRVARREWRRATHKSPHPSWPQVLRHDLPAWRAAKAAARRGPRVLVATTTGGYAPGAALESLLAVALSLRGAEVEILLCDEALPACMQAQEADQPERPFAQSGPAEALCPGCFWPAERMFRGLDLPVHRLSQTLADEEYASARAVAEAFGVEQVGSFKMDGLAVGEHAIAGALRYYGRGTLPETPEATDITRRYLRASLLTAYSVRRLLEQRAFDVVVCHHGIYVPQGLIGEVARRLGVRVVNWSVAYRRHSFIFSHGDTYHHTLLDEPTSEWDGLEWTDDLDRQLEAYLQSRRHGTHDWVLFAEKQNEDVASIARDLGVDFTRPCIGMLTNVVWDAQLHYRAASFSNIVDWAIETIRYFERRPELQLVIRVHPAEIRGTIVSRQPMVAEIHKAFPTLPANVFVIPPERSASTYAVMERCNAVLIYGTKTGVELTARGIPTIVAGEAWIRNKGLTKDATSPEEYFALLDTLPVPERLPQETVVRARKYAFHFFFRRMIPLPFMEPVPGRYPPYRLGQLRLPDLEPGRDDGLDVICNGILRGSPFVYAAERLASVGDESSGRAGDRAGAGEPVRATPPHAEAGSPRAAEHPST